jgi:hypothetical protein
MRVFWVIPFGIAIAALVILEGREAEQSASLTQTDELEEKSWRGVAECIAELHPPMSNADTHTSSSSGEVPDLEAPGS